MGEPLSLLIVEDNAHYAKMLRAIIAYNWPNADVTHVDGKEAAARLLHEKRFSCVLLDLTLRNGAGMAVIDRLLEFAPPLVIVTGDNDPETRKKALRHGAQEFITKDKLTRLNLPRLVENAMDRAAGVGHLIGARSRDIAKALAEDLANG